MNKKRRHKHNTKFSFDSNELKVVKRAWTTRIGDPFLFRIKSIFNAIHGVLFSIYSQRNFQIHIISGFAVLGLSIYFQLNKIEWLFIIFSITLVLVTEAVNTAIEMVTDLATKKRHVRAMLAKDIAAGAVFLSVINAIIVGYMIFFDKLLQLIKGGKTYCERYIIIKSCIIYFFHYSICFFLKCRNRIYCD